MNKTKKPELSDQKVFNTEHYSFIKHVTQKQLTGKKFHPKKYSRKIGTQVKSSSYTKVINADDRYLIPNLKIHPEFAAFLFHIEGCSKNLLFFIIMQLLDDNMNKYLFNSLTVDQYQEYCNDIFGTKYKPNTITQAHRTLVEKCITLNVSKGNYFLNPLLAGSKSETNRRFLIEEYSELLGTKEKDAFNDIYPAY